MLQSLHLQNFALSCNNEISLDQGFNVITGETGAGKSLLLDALMLAMGGRASGDMVRFGAKSADIYANFFFASGNANTQQVAAWFDEQNRPFDGELVIRRQINTDNRSKAWINGSPISLQELRGLATTLVNIHSQHAGLQLLKPSFALNFLDKMGDLTKEATALKHAYQYWQKLVDDQNSLADNLSQRTDRITLLQSKLADIEPLIGVDLKATESAYEELACHDELVKNAYQISQLLNSDGDSPCACDLLWRAIKRCESDGDRSQTFKSAYETLSECHELMRDTALTLQDYSETQMGDAFELERLNGILTLAHRLASKYRTPIDTLLDCAKDWQEELEHLQSLPDDADLAKDIDKAYQHYCTLSQQLHTARQHIAPKLCQKLQENLVALSLPHATCQFDFRPQKPSSHGDYEVQLLFGANVGMPLLPLHKVASGGELSRISLVMQVMSASREGHLPLLVFDEVDVGISGGTAQVVGNLLATLGNTQQILAITHQAQVAACSHNHILVKKRHDEQTSSDFLTIEGDEQINELARMSGGITITDETLAHAKSLRQSVYPCASSKPKSANSPQS